MTVYSPYFIHNDIADRSLYTMLTLQIILLVNFYSNTGSENNYKKKDQIVKY